MEDVQSLKLGQTEPHAPISLTGMDRLGERLGRHVRLLLEPLLGAKPTISVNPSETINYDLWSAMAPTFSALAVYRLPPLKGAMLLRLDPAMVSSLVEHFYGGSGSAPVARNEFTYGEERMIARVTEAFMRALVNSWRDVIELEFILAARETDPQALAFADVTDLMLTQTMEVKLGREQSWTIEMLFPVMSLRQIEPLLSSAGIGDGKLSDPLWRARLAEQVQHIRLPARTVLGRPSLQIDELLALKPGDVIPMNIVRSLPLIVGNQVVAHGSIGEQNGHAAFRIEKMN